MKLTVAALGAAAALLLTAGPSRALTLTFTADLSPVTGLSLVSGAPATGEGFARVVYVPDNTLALSVRWSGLSATTTVAHIHCCTIAPMERPIGPAVTGGTLPDFPVGVTEGSYARVFDLTDPSTYASAFIARSGFGRVEDARVALLNGLVDILAYFNIHSRNFSGGEIDGFFELTAVPGPGALGLFGAGLLGLAALRRRGAAAA